MKRVREQIGPFVITGSEHLSTSGIVCAQCDKLLAVLDPATDMHTPPPEELLRAGAVPVPNFGWFCCQDCGGSYETESGVRFQRNAAGLISYYGPGE